MQEPPRNRQRSPPDSTLRLAKMNQKQIVKFLGVNTESDAKTMLYKFLKYNDERFFRDLYKKREELADEKKQSVGLEDIANQESPSFFDRIWSFYHNSIKGTRSRAEIEEDIKNNKWYIQKKRRKLNTKLLPAMEELLEQRNYDHGSLLSTIATYNDYAENAQMQIQEDGMDELEMWRQAQGY